MGVVPRAILLLLLLAALMAAALPATILLAERMLLGTDRIYALIPLGAALAMAGYLLFLMIRGRRRRLLGVFIVALPLISTLHRRLELAVHGMNFYVETLLVLLLAFFLWRTSRLRGYPIAVLVCFMLGAFALALASAAVNGVLDAGTGWFLVQEQLLPFILFFLVLSVTRETRELDAVIRALMVSLVVYAALSLVWVFVLDKTIDLDVSQVLAARTRISGGVRRLLVGAGFVNSEVGNRVFMLLAPVAAVLIRGRAFRAGNFVYYAIIFASTYFIIATEHRAALLGGMLVFLLFVLFGRTRNVRTWMKLAALCALLFLLHERILEYLNRRILLDESLMMDGSAQKRLVMWRYALDLFHRRPWLGIGPLQYLDAAMNTPAQAITPHNYYLTLLAEQGALGLLGYLGALGAIFARGFANLRRLVSPASRRLNFGVMAGLFNYQFVLLFGGGRLSHNNVIYIHGLFWIVASLLWLLPRLEQEAPAPAGALTAPADAAPGDGHGESSPPVPAPVA
jgi:O-antigen ligase